MNHPHGRGTVQNPANRFESHSVELEAEEAVSRKTHTQFLPDSSQSIISRNDSPDIPFEQSLNPYRGCEHGCAYCYARPTHEYLGYSSGLDFESRILYKPSAALLLREALESPRWQAKPLVLSGVTDPYQPAERRFQLTRACLEVLAEFRQPVSIITKNAGVLRDLDLLKSMASWGGAAVTLSVTTLDAGLARRLEPRTASPRQRLNTVHELAEAGIPVGVFQAPIIPGLTDIELPKIIEATADQGGQWFGYQILRLPRAVKDIFRDWLQENQPGKADRILNRIRELRGGNLNDSRFGHRMKGDGIWAEQLKNLHRLGLKKSGLREIRPQLNTDAFRRTGGSQMILNF